MPTATKASPHFYGGGLVVIRLLQQKALLEFLELITATVTNMDVFPYRCWFGDDWGAYGRHGGQGVED